MTAVVFYAVVSGMSLVAIVAELLYARRTAKAWHTAPDTLGNFNLAAGNVMLGAVTVAIVIGGYTALYELRVVDLADTLPAAAVYALAIVAADFLQYWVHRASHRWNLLWWGHITHHSSSQLNLSTGIRVNWCYRMYAWALYAPMPLLGFPIESYLLAQTVINVYNLFMHTRVDVPFGPLGWLLVTPTSHRLHHSAHPEYFGNYGAALIVWDRLFGTYREVAADDTRDLAFGIDENVDSADPLRLNFHYLGELWRRARAEKRSFVGLLLSTTPLPSRKTSALPATTTLSRGWWLGCVALVVAALVINQTQNSASAPVQAVMIVAGVGATAVFGVALQRWVRRTG